jgi:hypothetical protein
MRRKKFKRNFRELSGRKFREPLNEEALDEKFRRAVGKKLDEYIKATEIPILGEFSVSIGFSEWRIKAEAEESKYLQYLVSYLESKKKAALERKIYNGELNATIGANLLKTWREK